MDQLSFNKSDKPTAPETLKHNNPWWYSKPLALILAALMVVIALWVFWRLMISNTEELGEANLPIITADSSPLTMPPPQGNEEHTPQSNKQVYGLISDRPKIEITKLKESTEEPLMGALPIEEGSESKIDENNDAVAMNNVEEMVLPPPDTSASPKKGVLYKIQMASFPSRAAAEQEKIALEHRFGSALNGIDGEIIEKNIKNKGIYFRLVYGSFESKEEAWQLCNTLKSQGAQCIITR